MKKSEVKEIVISSIILIMTIILSGIILFTQKNTNAGEEEQEITEKLESKVETSLINYSNYSIDEQNQGVVIQINVKNSVDGIEKAKVAIDNTMTLIQLPKIDEEYPKEVKVITKSTQMTNGKKGIDNGEYKYDETSGRVFIKIKNEAEEEKDKYINSKEGTSDEYEIICKYSKECYSEENEERELNIIAVSQEKFLDKESTTIQAKQQKTEKVSKNIHQVVFSSIKQQDIYDGYIKANYRNDSTYQTEFSEKTQITIDNAKINGNINLEENNKFIDEQNKEVNIEKGIIYKQTKVNKNNMLKVLGDEGYIKIYREDGSLIQEVTKETQSQEDGTISINYDEEINNIKIEVSEPKEEGIIEILNKKAIKETMKDLTVKKIKTVQKIAVKDVENEFETKEMVQEEKGTIQNINTQKVDKTQKAVIQKQAIIAETIEKENEIKSSNSNIDININNTKLTNQAQNEAEISVLLRSKDNKDNLFKDPEIEIELPSNVEKVVLGNVSLVYGNGLEKQTAEIRESENGNKKIFIKLIGEQKSYIEELQAGTSIIIQTKMILKQNITNENDTINITIKNNIFEEQKNVEQEIKKTIPIEIYAANAENKSAENNNNNPSNEKDNKEILDQNALEMNCYAQVGAKKLVNGDNVHEREVIKYVVTVTNKSKNEIKNIEIIGGIPENTTYATIDIGEYLNPKYEYIKDESVTQYKNSISTLNPGETKTEFYEVVVNDLEQSLKEKEILNTLKIKVGEQEYKQNILTNNIIKAKLEMKFEMYIERDQKNSFTYYLSIKNLTNEAMNNIEITSTEFQKEMNVLSAQYFENEYPDFGNINNGKLKGIIEKLEPDETKIICIKMLAENFDKNVNEVPLSMAIEAKLNDDIYRTWEARRNAYPEYVTVEMDLDKEGEEVNWKDDLTYTVRVKNESKIRTVVNVKNKLPNEIQGKLISYDNYIIEGLRVAENGAIVDEDGNIGSFINTRYNIHEEENLKYTLEHQEIDISGKNSVNGKELNELDDFMIIPAGKSVEIKITGTAKRLLKTTEVSNYVTVSGEDIDTVTSNITKFTLLSGYEDIKNDDEPSNPDNPNDPENPSDPDNPNNPENPDDTTKTYAISGTVWKDDNKDGKRDSSESGMGNVTVKLYNANTNTLVTSKNGTAQQTVTSKNGEYEFLNIEKGKYLVLFEFDTTNYAITSYQKQGVDSKLNSDAILKKVSINGVVKNVGITDTLEILNSNVTNIDMGLISNAVFDMKLDKYISKITVENSQGVKQYNYDDTQLAKVEIKAKYLKNSKVTVEYKIKVTNEGDVVGYIDNVIDYKPQEFEFDSSNNKGWSKDGDKLVNTSLSSELIAPGENKELTLILTKTMTEDSTGTIVNAAEIGESRNLENLPDKDSVANNKNKAEDDYSEAQVIISVGTGIITFTIITIIILIILLFVIFKFRKNLKGRFKIVTRIFTILLMSTILMTTNTDAWSESTQGRYVLGKNEIFVWYLGKPEDLHLGALLQGSDGRQYICQDSRFHQCKLQRGHVYIYNGGQESERQTKRGNIKDINIEKINTTLTIKSKGEYNIVGPYKLKVNCTEASIAEINIISQKGKENSLIVDKDGNAIRDLNMKINQEFTFYLMLKNDVAIIRNVNVKVHIENAGKVSEVYEVTERYRCKEIVYVEGEKHRPRYNGETITPRNTQPIAITTNKETIKEIFGTDKYVDFDQTFEISGNLKIIKDGSRLAQRLKDVVFEIRGPNNYYNKVTTDSNGEILVKNLKPGNYTIKEVAVNNNGMGQPNYGYKVSEDKSKTEKTITVKAGTTSTASFRNTYLLGGIELTKQDKDSGAKMQGVEFTIKMLDGEKKGKYLNFDSQGRATYHDNKQVLKTNADGKIKIDYVWIGTYEIIEIKNPYRGYEEIPSGGKKEESRTVESNDWKKFTIENKRKYIDLSGFVWEDMIDQKESVKNGIYDDKDKLVQHVKVSLIDNKNNKVVKETYTDKDGKYKFEDVEIDSIPNYYVEFEYNGMSYKSIPADIGDSKEKDDEKKTGSKAIDTISRDEKFEGKYAEIVKGQANNENGEKTYDLKYDTSQKYTSKLSYGENVIGGYENAAYPIYGWDGKQEERSNFYEQYLVKATTSEAYGGKMDSTSGRLNNEGNLDKIHTPTEIRKNGIFEIKNINLGIIQREQPDLSLIDDIHSVSVEINGANNNKATHIYKYNERFEQQEEEIKNMDPKVKFEEKYGNMSYTRALCASDIMYGTTEGVEAANSIQVRVIYKIGISNSSTNLDAVINKLYFYYDNNFEIETIGKLNERTNKVEPDTSKIKEYNDDSANGKVTINSNINVNKEGMDYVYVQMKVKNDSLVKMVGDKSPIKTQNVVEIASYTIKENGKIYAGIDIDSEPGNANPKDENTYEDDTDKAPGFTIVLQDERVVSGKVFEDATDEELKTGEERKGNGYFDEKDGDHGIGGIEVTLLQKDGTIAKVYTKGLNNKWEAKDAKTKTDKNGNYTFRGIIPGYYYVKFEWGGKEYTYEVNNEEKTKEYSVYKYKGVTVKEEIYNNKTGAKGFWDSHWYKDGFKQNYPKIEWNIDENKEIRVSDAMDDYEARKKYDEEITELTNKIVNEAVNSNGKTMTSTTPTFKVDLEYVATQGYNVSDEYETDSNGIVMNGVYAVKKDGYKNNINSIDFGIVERPRQEILLEKRVENVKIVLANGLVLMDAKVEKIKQADGTYKYELAEGQKNVVYIPASNGGNGMLKVEMDNEIMQGAVITIKYAFDIKNISELDYNDETYYKYGGMADEEKLVKITPKKIIDYMDDKSTSVSIESDASWKIEEARNNLIANGLLSSELQETLDTVNKVLIHEINETIAPGESVSNEIADLTVAKLLSSATEVSLDNDAEVIEISKTGGGLTISTPGNYVPAKDVHENDDSKSESVVVTPPQGANKDYKVYVILGISILIIASTGIIFIKRKILH